MQTQTVLKKNPLKHTLLFILLLQAGFLSMSHASAKDIAQINQQLQLPVQQVNKSNQVLFFDSLDTETTDSKNAATANTPAVVKPAADMQAQTQKELAQKQLAEKYITFNEFVIHSDVNGVSVQQMQDFLASKMDGIQKQANSNSLQYKDIQQLMLYLENWLALKHQLVKARVFLPMQDMSDGKIALTVHQGSISGFVVSKEVQGSKLETDVLKILNKRLDLNSAITVPKLEQAAYRIMDYIKTPVSMVLVPKSSGQYDVLVDVDKPKKFSGVLSVDNTGSEYTNQYKDSIFIGMYNATNHMDHLYFSGQRFTPNQQLYKLRYEKPFINGTQLAAEVSKSSYKLCCDFESLNVRGNKLSAALEYQLGIERTRKRSQQLTGFVKQQLLDSSQHSNTVSDIKIQSTGLQYAANLSNKVADHQFNMDVTLGKTNIQNQAEKQQDKLTTNTDGKFIKLEFGYDGKRPVSNKGSVNLNLSGQWSNNNLTAAEKISVGGLDAIRALPYGELSVDHAVITQLEYQHRLSPMLSSSLFFDAGFVRPYAKNWDGNSLKNRFNVYGVGASATWAPLPQVELDVVVAKEIITDHATHTKSGKDKSINTWVTGKWFF